MIPPGPLVGHHRGLIIGGRLPLACSAARNIRIIARRRATPKRARDASAPAMAEHRRAFYESHRAD